MLRKNIKAFTLIELMIVMTIVSLLLGLVGPLAINSLEKAQAKQELLSVKNWLKKISYRAFHTGSEHQLVLSGKRAELFVINDAPKLILSKEFEALFFQPQHLRYTKTGFVTSTILTGTFRNQPLTINLAELVNHLDQDQIN